jgi:prolipoprotein diacylglyceryltransferase
MPFVIDIDPVAFTILGLPVRWYGLILVAAAWVTIWLAQREARRRGVAPQLVWDGVLWVGVAALVGGRALYVIQNELGSIAERPAHVLMFWIGGDESPVFAGLKTSQWLGLGIGVAAVVLFIAVRRREARRLPVQSIRLEALRP